MHDRCCTGPRSGYLGSTIYAKTCLVTLLPWIWKPSFGNSFSIFSPTGSTFFIQLECTRGWSLHLEITPPERNIIDFMQVATFIMQNWCIYTIWRCAPCRMDMGKDEFHSCTREGFFTIRCSNRFWGGVWSDMTTEQVLTHTKMVSGVLTWGCRLTQNTLAKWMCASLLTTVYPNWGDQWPPGWVFWAALWGMSPQRLETSPTGRFWAVHAEHRSSSTQ